MNIRYKTLHMKKAVKTFVDMHSNTTFW